MNRGARRPTIYLRDNLVAMIKEFPNGNVSAKINNFCDRYKYLVEISKPAFSVDEYIEIFTTMADYRFDQDIAVEIDILPDIMEQRGISEEIVLAVQRLKEINRVALIDLIEKAQS